MCFSLDRLLHDDHGQRGSNCVYSSYLIGDNVLQSLHIWCFDLRDDIVDAVSRGETG
jgi:hypothetical protein